MEKKQLPESISALVAVDKKDRTKKIYLANVYKGNFPGSDSVRIGKNVTREQWMAIYDENAKGKDGSFWLNLNQAKKQAEKTTTESADADILF